MDNYKRWMLKFQWVVGDMLSDETFYFDTKEQMLEFIKQDGVRVEKMFHLVDVEIE